MTYAYYNEYGDITSVCSHPNMDGPYIEVPVGTVPEDVWIDPESGEIHSREPHEWPEIVTIEDGLEVPAHDCCATFVNGVKQSAGSTFVPEVPGHYVVEMKGRRSGTRAVLFAGYAELRKRAYPGWAEQFDLFWHGLNEAKKKNPDAWADLDPFFDRIAAVKDAYPKG